MELHVHTQYTHEQLAHIYRLVSTWAFWFWLTQEIRGFVGDDASSIDLLQMRVGMRILHAS